MDRVDLRRRCDVLKRSPRRRTLQPRIKSAGGDPQQSAHHPNRIGGLVLFHELEDRFEFTAVSCANQAAVFARISPLQPQLPVGHAQAAKLLTLSTRQPILALALVAIGLRHPVTDRLGCGLELPRQLLGRTTEPARPFARETQAGRVLSSLASWTPFIVRSKCRCPRKRVKPTVPQAKQLLPIATRA